MLRALLINPVARGPSRLGRAVIGISISAGIQAGCGASSAQRTGPDDACKREMRSGAAYWFCNTGRTFDEARTRCAAVGMDLAAIEDKAESDFLLAQITTPSHFGLSDRIEEGVWRWTFNNELHTCSSPWPSGSTHYANWAGGEPLHGASDETTVFDRNDCAWLDMATNSSGWKAGNCDTLRGYICESLPRDASHAVRFDEIATEIREVPLGRPPQEGRWQVSYAKLTGKADLTRVFQREQDRFGLRPCLDTLIPESEARRIAGIDQSDLVYELHYKGIPVSGRGYTVRRDTATGELQSLNGLLSYNLDVPTDVRVRQEIAFQVAAATSGGPSSDNQSNLARLILYPVSQDRQPMYELAWEFSFPRVSKSGGYIVVSAQNGEVLFRESRIIR